jgi:LEA14-like dessication related protein
MTTTNHRISRALAALIITCWGLGAGGGCISRIFPDYQNPDFEVMSAEVTQETEEGYVVTFTLKGHNSNYFAMPLHTVDYSLSLDAKRVYSGQRITEATLPRRGSQTVRLPVPVKLGDSAKAEALLTDTATDQGDLNYRLVATFIFEVPGSIAEVLFDNDIRKPSHTFASSGTLEISPN